MDIFKNRPLAFTLLVFLTTFFISLLFTSVVKIILLCVALLFFVISVFTRKRFDIITGAFFALLFAFFFSFAVFNVFNTVYPVDGSVQVGRFEVYDVVFKSEESVFFNARVKELNGERCNFKCNFVYNSAKTDINEGDILYGQFKFCELENGEDGFNEKSYYASLGIYNAGYINTEHSLERVDSKSYPVKSFFDSVKSYCSSRFKEYTSEEAYPLLSSLTTGDKSLLSDSVKRDFSRLGISHMLAISGMHLAVIMNCIGIFTDLFGLSKRNNSIFVMFICIFYILLTGASASILRSGIMFMVMHLAFFVKRSGDSLTSLLLAVSMIIVFSPSSVYDIGLMLSFTATFGIIIITPPFVEYANKHRGKIRNILNWLMISVITTVAALTFSLVPMIVYFDEFSIVSVISNLLLNIPATAILTLIPIFLVFSWFDIFAFGIGFALDLCVKLFLYAVKYISGFEGITFSTAYPFVWITLIVYVLGMIAAFVLKKRSLYILSFAVWFAIFCLSGCLYDLTLTEPKILYSSIKSSDAILMRTDKSSIYFDFGNISKNATKKSFSLLNSELYCSELDAWIIGAYTDNTKSTLQKYMALEYISVIYLPTPCNDVEQVTAEEILYYADKECTDIEFFEYNKAFSVCNSTVYITMPEAGSSNKIYSANIEYEGLSTAYYSLGYFEKAAESFDAENIFLGGGGSTRKQDVMPKLNCTTLVYSDKNTESFGNIKAKNKICLNENKYFYKE